MATNAAIADASASVFDCGLKGCGAYGDVRRGHRAVTQVPEQCHRTDQQHGQGEQDQARRAPPFAAMTSGAMSALGAPGLETHNGPLAGVTAPPTF